MRVGAHRLRAPEGGGKLTFHRHWRDCRPQGCAGSPAVSTPNMA